MLKRELTIGTLFFENQKKIKFKLLNTDDGFNRVVSTSLLHRPGLALAGFLEPFTYDRIQILGNTEIQFLTSLPAEKRKKSLEKVLSYEIPCFIITDNNESPSELIPIANKRKICVFNTKYSTMELFQYLGDYLNNEFAPRETVHGTLVDVYGIGVLFTGRSGIGKSEIALDLVERGHRLVADDVVIITKKAEEILMGEGRELAEHHLEIRGLGLIDTRSTFGIRAVRIHKRVEVEVQLVEFDSKIDYDRTGLDEQFKSILGVKIPLVVLPINPGKNITVIAETIALNQLLKIYGHHTPTEFNKRLMNKMREKEKKYIKALKTRDFLDKDFE
jgi:HPr kinase/phosphorylase